MSALSCAAVAAVADHGRDDEAELVRALRAGDEAAFERLVREHGGRLLAVARRLLGCAEEAADAVQDAFLAAHRSIRSFAGKSRLGTWLHRIVVNAALMRLRRRRHDEVSIEALLPTFASDGHRDLVMGDPHGDAAPDAEQAETRALVRRCIERLPVAYRTVLVLRDLEELDTEETARVLGTHRGVVKVRLHRARAALRELLVGERRNE